MKYDYDMLVVGAGAAGLTAAKTAKGFGKRVALVEKTDRLGGECTWTGCIPSKTLIKTAAVAHYTKQLDRYGLQSKTPLAIETTNVMSYVRAVIEQDYQSHTPDKVKALGIDVLFGNLRFIDQHIVDLDGRTISFSKAIISTGSHPFVPPIDGIDSVSYLTNENLFSLDTLPRSMIILGGGAIGCEMASALNRLGVAITIIEMNDRILPKEDVQLVGMLTATMEQEGVTIITSAKATKVEQQSDMVCLSYEDKAGSVQKIKAERLLIAVGRRPNLDGLALDQVGISTTAKAIVVDTTLRTGAKNIYAAGDVVGPYQFSHMAWYQAVLAARNAIIPLFKKKVNYDDVLWVTFTAPELARAGLTEEQARVQYGDRIAVYEQPYRSLDRAITDQATNGLAKFIVGSNGQLLGMHMLGARAGDSIHEVQLAKSCKIPLSTLASVIHAYPTYAEINWHAAKQAYISKLKGNFFVKLMEKLFMRRS